MHDDYFDDPLKKICRLILQLLTNSTIFVHFVKLLNHSSYFFKKNWINFTGLESGSSYTYSTQPDFINFLILKLCLKSYPVGAHLHPSLLPHPLFLCYPESFRIGDQEGSKLGKPRMGSPNSAYQLLLFPLIGCPPLAYIMRARYIGHGAKVMLAIGYGYPLIWFCY